MSGNEDRAGAPGSGHELAGADQLISDLAALLDAGLLVVHESVLGPARYGIAPVSDHHAGRRKARISEPRAYRSRVGIMHS
ncbi:MAG TPA: hypothetical protein VLC49_00720 [Solirubrobacteraceae bacterium]|nr:hypothetical protein [Solirubrobacteraceae bacterium]